MSIPQAKFDLTPAHLRTRDKNQRLNPAARGWIELDLGLLRSRSVSEWRKAHSLAKALSLRWVKALGGDVDDVAQEALLALSRELDKLQKKQIAPSRALCRIFFTKATHTLRTHRARNRFIERLPAETQSSLGRPDLELDEQKLADAFEAALRLELEAADPKDRLILQGALLGRSGREIADEVGLAESTVSYRKTQIIKRLRLHLQQVMENKHSLSTILTEDE